MSGAAAADSGLGPLSGTPFSEPARTTSASPGSLLDKEIKVLTNQGLSHEQAWRALEVQGRIAQANLPGKLQTAMGDDFAGVWFDNPTAQLQVGVASHAARRVAERVIAQEGLSANVAIVPVRSTMAQLLAVQRQWNRKLAGLFAREQVSTGLEPQQNAVSVRLAASVPTVQRDVLEQEARIASTNVLVTVTGGTIVPLAATKCNIFEKGKENANCEPSITAGVRLASASGICTAGPVAINENNERVLLTAGHCIEKEGEEWKATNTKGVSSKLGKSGKFFAGGAAGTKLGDYGEITIEPAWQTGVANNPVLAVTAEWKSNEETSFPIKGEREPVVKNMNCHEGQTSGESCGEIARLNVIYVTSGTYKEGTVEDAGENLYGEGGDSGGPWLFVETNKEARMEGTMNARVAECLQLGEVKKGPPFFKTQTECISRTAFAEAEGNEGEWERMEYKCAEVAKVEQGAKFYMSKEACEKLENAGEGKWERKPELHLVWEPLKQPVAGAAEGSLEKLKLRLLTTANERIKATPGITPAGAVGPFTDKSGAVSLAAKGGLSGAEVKCASSASTGGFQTSLLGTFDVLFKECLVKVLTSLFLCTGLNATVTSSILALGTFHLRYRELTGTRSVAAFLLIPVHFV